MSTMTAPMPQRLEPAAGEEHGQLRWHGERRLSSLIRHQHPEMLTHAHVVAHEGSLWLCGATHYVAAALRLYGNAPKVEHLSVPLWVLRAAEREQENVLRWTMTPRGVRWDGWPDDRTDMEPPMDFAAAGVLDLRAEGEHDGCDRFGADASYLVQAQAAIGAFGLRFITGERPDDLILVRPVGEGLIEAQAVIQPIRDGYFTSTRTVF